MPVFEYKATDANGNPLSGTVLSTSLSAAADDLSKRGLNVNHIAVAAASNDPIPQSFSNAPRPAPSGQVRPSVETARTVEPAKPNYSPPAPPPTTPRSAVVTQVVSPLVYRVPLPQLMFLFRQLSTMLNAGVPMIASLETLAKQTRDPKLNPVVKELLGHVLEGRELSVGMERYPDVFSPLMLGMIKAGEQSGMLDQSLKQMADYVEQEIALRNLLRKATLYPKIVLGSSIAMVFIANYFIRMTSANPELMTSPLTEPATWLVLTPIIFFLFIFFRVGVNNPNIKVGYDKFLLMIPAIGSTVHQMAMAKFSRAFAALYKGGVPMARAVEYAADACGSSYLRSKIRPAAKELQEGDGITDAFRRTGAFLPQVLDLTQTGETTGQLDEMLDKAAEYYEGDTQVKSDQIAKFFGLACLILVGLYVGYLVVHFYGGYGAKIQSAGAGE